MNHNANVQANECHTSFVRRNIKTIMSETYDVEPNDYTILCDSINNTINITLPPACDHIGRILSIKKTNQNPTPFFGSLVIFKIVFERMYSKYFIIQTYVV